MNKYSVSLSNRLVAMVTYLTAGWFGFFYAIVFFLLKKKLSPFLRYNILQAIFIAFVYFVLCMVLGLICSLLSHIPFVQIIVSWFQLLFNRPVFFQYSLVQLFICGLFLYMALISLMGRYPRVYWVSNIIERSF